MENNNLSLNEAIKFIDRVEKERDAFRKAIKAGDSHADNFDMNINRATFTTAQCVEIILLAIEKKSILSDYKQKVEFF